MDRIRKFVPFQDRPPFLLKARSSKLFITIAVCIAVFTDVFLYGVVVPVIPFAIHVRANVPQAEVQHWVSVLLAVYGASLLIGSPICGIVADRMSSRQAPLLGGLIALAGSTVMLCLARSLTLLLLGRILQGLSAAVMWTVALALLSDTVGKEESGEALGYVAMAYSLGFLVAPLLGGVVYDRSGYYAVFGMTFGVIALDIILRLLIIEKKRAMKWLPRDEAGPGEIEQPNKADTNIELETETHPETAGKATTNANTHPKKPKRKLPTILILLKSPRILAAFWGNFVGACTLCAFDATLPLFVNRTFGWNSLGAGLIFIAPIVPSFSGPIIGRFTDKYGPRWIAATGLISSLPFWVLLRFVEYDDIRQVVLLCALLALVGASMALTLTSLMSEFSKVCDAKERQDPDLFAHRSAYAQSFGIFNSAWAAGSLVGPLWAAAVEARGGWKMMTWTLGLFNAVSAVPVLLYSGGFITRRKNREVPEGAVL